MRARIAIFKAQQRVLLRDLVLSNKPDEMLASSAKGTVPVLVVDKPKQNTGPLVIDESLEIMLWTLANNDPGNLLCSDEPDLLFEMLSFITLFDTEFKLCLEDYKCAKRYHEDNIADCRARCEQFITTLEQRLERTDYIMSNNESVVDIALLPFIRQFARIERQWYLQSPYPKLRHWLNRYLQSVMFTKVMAKYPLWLDKREDVFFI